jgi:hypothetical protein
LRHYFTASLYYTTFFRILFPRYAVFFDFPRFAVLFYRRLLRFTELFYHSLLHFYILPYCFIVISCIFIFYRIILSFSFAFSAFYRIILSHFAVFYRVFSRFPPSAGIKKRPDHYENIIILLPFKKKSKRIIYIFLFRQYFFPEYSLLGKRLLSKRRFFPETSGKKPFLPLKIIDLK